MVVGTLTPGRVCLLKGEGSGRLRCLCLQATECNMHLSWLRGLSLEIDKTKRPTLVVGMLVGMLVGSRVCLLKGEGSGRSLCLCLCET